MTYLIARLEVPDFDTWKRDRFDQDPAGRAQAGKGHRLYRSVENPNEVIVQVEFASADDARSFRERLGSSGAFDGLTVVAPPRIVEEAEAVTY
jgi:protein required for attachment to host cells